MENNKALDKVEMKKTRKKLAAGGKHPRMVDVVSLTNTNDIDRRAAWLSEVVSCIGLGINSKLLLFLLSNRNWLVKNQEAELSWV